MGKHDIKTATNRAATSSEEHLMNRIADLEKRLAFAAETNAKLIKENVKWQKLFKEHDTSAQDRIAELEKEIALRDEKIAKLVRLYV